jgi:hypothetical protein
MAGRGSIEQRDKDSWRLIVFCGYGLDGKQIKKTNSAKAPDKKAAELLLAGFLTEVEKGMFIDRSGHLQGLRRTLAPRLWREETGSFRLRRRAVPGMELP